MPNLKLESVEGEKFTWAIKDGNYQTDNAGHVIAFTGVYNDGTSEHFYLAETGNQHKVLEWLDEHVSSRQAVSTGGMVGMLKAAKGAVIGISLGYVAKAVLHHFIVSQHGNYRYYNGSKKACFYGPVPLSS